MSARKARLDRGVSVDRKAHRGNAARKVSADLKGLAVSQVPVVLLAREASVAPLGRNWFAVARLEWNRDPGAGGLLRQQVLGLAWRPNPGLSLKLEWLHLDLGRPGPAGSDRQASLF